MTNSRRSGTVYRLLPDLLLAAFAVALLVLAALFTANQNFWLDEYFSIHAASLGWEGIAAYTAGDVHPPLYYYLLKAFLSVLGQAPVIYRLASFAAYVFTIGMALVLFRPAFGRLATLLFLCLMGPNVASLHYFTEVRMYGWALFFVLLCGFAGYRLVAADDPPRRWWITLTVAGLAAGYLHYFALLAVAFVYLALLVYSLARRRMLLRGWGIAAAVSIVCYLPWVALAALRLTQQVSTFWLQEPPALQETLELIVGNQLSSWLALFLLVVGCVVYLVWPRQAPAANRWLVATGLLTAVGLPVFGYAATFLVRPMYLPRYFFPAAGLLWLGMAVAASGLIRRLRPTPQRCTGVLLTALLLYAMAEPAQNALREMVECNAVVAQDLAFVEERYQEGDRIYSTVDLVDQRVLDFFFPEQNTAAGTDPSAALPEPGGSLFLIYQEEDPTGAWADALTQAGLQMDSWQGALLDNTWCRIYYYVPAAS